MNEDSEDGEEPWYEAEWCEECAQEADDSGIEYEHNMTWQDGVWVCDSCGTPQ